MKSLGKVLEYPFREPMPPVAVSHNYIYIIYFSQSVPTDAPSNIFTLSLYPASYSASVSWYDAARRPVTERGDPAASMLPYSFHPDAAVAFAGFGVGSPCHPLAGITDDILQLMYATLSK